MRHAVLDVKNDCLVSDTMNPDSMTLSLEPREKKSRVRECDVCVG